MAIDVAPSVLLEVAALKYARAIEAWRTCYQQERFAGQVSDAQRAIEEARAQLQSAAYRLAFVPWGAGGQCSSCGFRYVAHEGHIIPCPLCEVKQLRERVRVLESFKRGVDEALNSGDGSYRP